MSVRYGVLWRESFVLVSRKLAAGGTAEKSVDRGRCCVQDVELMIGVAGRETEPVLIANPEAGNDTPGIE